VLGQVGSSIPPPPPPPPSLRPSTLSLADITSCNFQLVGMACLLLASKLEEIYALRVKDLVIASDHSFTEQQLKDMEKHLVVVLKWSLHSPTVVNWMGEYVKRMVRRLDEEEAKHEQSLLLLAASTTTTDQLQAMHHEYTRLKQWIQSRSLFERALSLIDLFMCDIQSLRFYPSALVVTSLFLIHAESLPESSSSSSSSSFPFSTKSGVCSLLEDVTEYTQDTLHQARQCMYPYLTIPCISTKDRIAHFQQSGISSQYAYLQQLYHPEALKCIQEHLKIASPCTAVES
jgi:hypothetical protein